MDPYIEKIGPNLRTGGKEGGGSPRVGVRVAGAEGVASGSGLAGAEGVLLLLVDLRRDQIYSINKLNTHFHLL